VKMINLFYSLKRFFIHKTTYRSVVLRKYRSIHGESIDVSIGKRCFDIEINFFTQEMDYKLYLQLSNCNDIYLKGMSQIGFINFYESERIQLNRQLKKMHKYLFGV